MKRFYRSPKKSSTDQDNSQNYENRFGNLKETPQKFVNPQYQSKDIQDTSQGRKILTFMGCVIVIYICQIIHGVIHERMYFVVYLSFKVPYKNISTSKMDFYTDAITPMIFSTFFSAAIGYMRMDDIEAQVQIPIKKMLKLAILQIVITFGLTWVLMNTSYILVVMANSCNLLSVILIGVYFSYRNSRTSYQPNDELTENAQQNQHSQKSNRNSSQKAIGPQKILICTIVCAGIFVFNYFAPNDSMKQKDSTAQSASLLIFIILALIILLEGFYPQLQNQIKQEYQPSSICFYYNVNRVQFLTVLIIGIVTWQIPYSFNFVLEHDELFFHIVILALTNAISVMFVYKIITLFRQHVYPMVSTVRKCITVTVSILYFGHHINFAQFLGMVLVFGGVLLQILMNYKLLQKWDVNLPFIEEQRSERYVKNRHINSKLNGNQESKKRYEVYKVIDKEMDIQGI